MNIPNKLTVIRVILIPVFMLFYLMESEPLLYIALAVFVAATLTDHFDGKLARRNNQVTTFGKLMDPIADKLLIISAFVCFVQKGVPYISVWVVVIVLAREFIVTGVRMLAMGENNVIAASIWGKAKTVSQFVLVIAVIVFEAASLHLPQIIAALNIVICIMTIVSVVLTVLSGWDYVWKNRDLLTFK